MDEARFFELFPELAALAATAAELHELTGSGLLILHAKYPGCTVFVPGPYLEAVRGGGPLTASSVSGSTVFVRWDSRNYVAFDLASMGHPVTARAVEIITALVEMMVLPEHPDLYSISIMPGYMDGVRYTANYTKGAYDRLVAELGEPMQYELAGTRWARWDGKRVEVTCIR